MSRALAGLLVLLATPLALHADGCKFTRTGRFVPEREQRARSANLSSLDPYFGRAEYAFSAGGWPSRASRPRPPG